MSGAIADELRHLVAQAQRIVVLTGSGISVESGVPTFRDAQTGLWAQYRPEDLATPRAFERDPQLVWAWYEWRRGLVRGALPNAAHRALALLAHRKPATTIVTQNVDGLHQRAGSPVVVEFHGNLFVDRCSRGCHRQPCSEKPLPEPPQCPRCASLMRPGVVWFGESIPEDALRAAQEALTTCDLLMSVGTSSLVYPAAGLAEMAAARSVCIVEVNPGETPLSGRARFRIRERAALALPGIVGVTA